ncbi:MAG TPA: lytic transglycosylase domain-containing protein [Acidimicrobiales bacterium]|nr:lytic transglycosylase domain-containing protein [Acidimicrobiales bacterium]
MILLLVLGGAVVAFLALILVALVLFTLAVISGGEAVAQSAGAPSPVALADIPAELLSVYQEAAEATCGMRWAVLAAIGKVETDHARSTLPGVHSGENFAGAGGPMQFLQPTWKAYGVDGDGDDDKDRYDPVDAIWGAAKYLCASRAGEPDRLRDAIFAYNHATWYVDKVLDQAAAYEAAPAVGLGDAQALVDHPNLSLTPGARQDLLDGFVDQRVVDFLAWAIERHAISVSVLKTGHSKYVAGTDRTSNHWEGRGVDIYAVDGEKASPGSSTARAFALEAIGLAPPARPTEIGLPWADLTGHPGVFTDGAHQGHLHFGWSR